jgi:hypothetical protein
MIEEEDRFLLPAPFQGSKKAPPTRRRFKDLAGDGLLIENLLKEIGPLCFVSRRVDGLNSDIFLKIAGGFV